MPLPLPPSTKIRAVTKPSPEMRRAGGSCGWRRCFWRIHAEPARNARRGVRTRRQPIHASGSMGSLTCVMAQRPGRVIYETHGHIYNYEMGALAAIAAASSR